jgi:hypothetical protein
MDFNRETNKTPDGVFLVQSDGQPNQLFLMEAKLNSRRYGEAAKQLQVYQDAAKKHPRYAKCSIIKVWAPYFQTRRGDSFESKKHQAAKDSIKFLLRRDNSLSFEFLWAEGSQAEGSAEI